MGNLLNPNRFVIPPPPFVISIERVSFSADGTNTQVALTKGQDPAQCVPISVEAKINTYNGSSMRPYHCNPAVTFFDNAGTPTLDADFFGISWAAAAVPDCDYEVTVVEFGPDIKIQSGTFENTGLVQDLRINLPESVTRSRTFHISYCIYPITHYIARWCNFKFLQSDTQMRFYTSSPASQGIKGVWYVIEDVSASNVHFNVNHYGHYRNNATNPYDIGISDLGQDIDTIMALFSNATGAWYYQLSEGTFCNELLNRTTVRQWRDDASPEGIWCYFQMVKFKNNTTVRHIGQQQDISGSNKNITISPAVDFARATLIGTPDRDTGGNAANTDTGTGNNGVQRMSLKKLTSGSNVNVSRYAACTSTYRERYAFQLVEWDMG